MIRSASKIMGTLNQDGRTYQILRRWVASGYYFEYDEYILGYYITQADLNKLLLDDIVLNDLKEVNLEDFYVWIKDNLESAQYIKEKEFYESNY